MNAEEATSSLASTRVEAESKGWAEEKEGRIWTHACGTITPELIRSIVAGDAKS